MPELYQSEDFIFNQVPVKVFNHCFDGTDIYTVLHWHRNVEFNLTTKGRIYLTIDGANEILNAGEWDVVNSGELHSNLWVSPEDHFEGVTVQISRSFLDHWLGEHTRFVRPVAPGAAREIENALLTFGEYHARGDADNLEKMELLFRFLILLRKYCLAPDEGDKKRDKTLSNIKGIVNYIDEHYQESLDLNGVAEEFHYTAAHLSRMFKEHIGYNFYTYLQSVRLMHCVEEMKSDPNIRLLDCAMNNGFPNVKSFIQTFKKSFGCTPSDWLKARNTPSH